MYIKLMTNRLKLSHITMKINWGYLYNEYKETAFFWEFMKMFVKVFIIVVLSYYE